VARLPLMMRRKRQATTRFGVRETPDWRAHAANLESEMLRRCIEHPD